MKIASLKKTPVKKNRSPQGKFSLKRQFLLQGSRPGDKAPFEVELDELPPGAVNYPFHFHTIDHECFIVVSGSGKVRTKSKVHAIKAGDYFDFPPGEPHQIINDSKRPLRYYVIANHSHGHDACFYPDSDKWGFDALNKIVTVSQVDYYHREE